MNTQQLNLFGNRHIIKFIGVYPLNKLPYIKDVGSFIVNTHTHNLPGQHWIAVHVGYDCIDLYDPLGYYYPQILVNYVNSFTRSVHYNRIMFQLPDLATCGHHCLLWLISINSVRKCCLVNYEPLLY